MKEQTNLSIYQEKIKRKLEKAKRFHKFWLLFGVFSGVVGVLNIVFEYYSGKLFQPSEIPLGVVLLILSFSYFYFYITKCNIKWWEKCLSPVNAVNLYKERFKVMYLIVTVGVIITLLFFCFFQNSAVQKSLLYQIGVIGIAMFTVGVLSVFYLQIKIKECKKYI